MAETKNTLLPWLRLVRAGTLFSPACDVVAGICISLAAAVSSPAQNVVQGGLVADRELLLAPMASVLVYAAGMVCNDLADRHEDARQRPERPIPRGHIRVWQAAVLAAALLAAALAISPCRQHHALLAGLALAYDFVLKRVRVLAALTMGTLRGLNLLTGAWVPLLWFIDFDMAGRTTSGVTSALLAAAICYAVYICFVTVLGMLEDSPSPRRRHVLLVQSIPPIAALTGITVVQGGLGLAPLLALAPLALFVRRMLQVQHWDQRAIRGSMLWLLLGTMLYTALLSLAAGSWLASLGIALCIAPARWIARRISLT